MAEPRPLDSIRFIHRLLLGGLARFDAAAEACDYTDREQTLALATQLEGTINGLGNHIKDEDELIFPLLAAHTPVLVRSYGADHESDRKHFKSLTAALEGLPAFEATEERATGRAISREVAILHASTRLHMEKEEAYFYPALNDNSSDDQQIKAFRRLFAHLPVQTWEFAGGALLGPLTMDEREEALRTFQRCMSEGLYAGLLMGAPKGMPAAEWAELQRRLGAAPL